MVWSWATHFRFPRKILRVLCGNFESTRGVYSSKDVRVEVELLALSDCVAACVMLGSKNLPDVEVEGFCG